MTLAEPAPLFPNTLATDPGATYFAVAVTNLTGALLFAKKYTLAGEDLRLPIQARALVLARRIFEDTAVFRCDSLLFEGQVTRRGGEGQTVVSGNDLLPLAFNNGAISVALCSYAWETFRVMPRVSVISPADWKGTVQGDKLIASTKASLTDDETSRMVHKNKDTFDAVAFAKWGAARRKQWS